MQARLYLGSCCSRWEREQVTDSLAHWAGGELVPYTMGSGVRPEGWLRCFAHPFGGVSAGGTCSTLLLLPALQKWQLGFWSFRILFSVICTYCACTQLFSLPYRFFIFYCLRKRLSWGKHCSKGSQVPGPSLYQCHRDGWGLGRGWGSWPWL